MENNDLRLIRAIDTGCDDEVEFLLSMGADVNARIGGQQHSTPFMLACGKGRLDYISRMIRAGADVNLVNDIGVSPLIFVIELGHVNIKCVDFLLRRGARPNIGNYLGDSALILSAKHIGMMEAYSTDPNPRMGHAGYGVYVRPVFFKDRDPEGVCRLLINYGADTDYVGRDGKTVLSILFEKKAESLIDLVLSKEMARR